jgi:arsenate reductase
MTCGSIPAAQRGAFSKEDGEQVIDATGNRVPAAMPPHS